VERPPGGDGSEELDRIYPIPPSIRKGKSPDHFDPLDGSSNIECEHLRRHHLSILRCPEGVTILRCRLHATRHQAVCAGYALYGPNTMMVLTTGHGVNGFTLDRDVASSS